MKRARWESENGYSAELGSTPPYIFEKIDSDGTSGEAQSVKSYGNDGETTYRLTRSQRNVSLKGTVVSYGNRRKWMEQSQAEDKDYLAMCFDPRYFGTLYYYAYIGDPGKKIRCRPTATPVFDAEFNNSVPFRVGFVSDGSTWSRVEPAFAAMGISFKNFRFHAYFFPTALGFVFTRDLIRNPTLYDLRPTLTVYGNENAIDIRNNTTGTFLKFDRAVTPGERIVIDTQRHRAYLEVQRNGKWVFAENVLNRLSLDSDISTFVIVPGENEIVIEKQMPSSEVTLYITANIPVMGV